ncbi:hypothetical protein BSK59_13620 [Paenibacillus odorifer]|uniref:hypothetical protein n=1 Tax=Paenibacillus odorifer TaxID=189426 RepID=UPI00096F4239|nr:hypothetical protein [Paenibacillus odorifer]OME55510.1 hypothetical protein BSK59_13620 [Paenibacillus odorifer]
MDFNVYVDWDGREWQQSIGEIDESKMVVGKVYCENEKYTLKCIDIEEVDEYEPNKRAYYLKAVYPK